MKFDACDFVVEWKKLEQFWDVIKSTYSFKWDDSECVVKRFYLLPSNTGFEWKIVDCKGVSMLLLGEKGLGLITWNDILLRDKELIES